MPREDAVTVRAGLCPGVADPPRQVVGEATDVRATWVGLRPIRRVGDEVVHNLVRIHERGLRTRGDDAQRGALLWLSAAHFTESPKSVTVARWISHEWSCPTRTRRSRRNCAHSWAAS